MFLVSPLSRVQGGEGKALIRLYKALKRPYKALKGLYKGL